MTYTAKSFQDLRGRPLPSGRTRKRDYQGVMHDVDYNREISFDPGYEELMRIVAGHGKEIKKINQALTLPGAQKYASKRKNWTAHEADITGPHGVPDGIKEVFITDSKGRLKVINGVGLGKSTYPIRKAYRTKYPTKESRKENKFTDFMDNLNEINEGFNEHNEPFYKYEAEEFIGDPEFKNIQREITVKNLYKQFIFAPVYNSYKNSLKAQVDDPLKMAHIYNKALSEAYNFHIVNPVLAHMLGGDPSTFSDKAVNRAKRSKDFKINTQNYIKDIFVNTERYNQCRNDASEVIKYIAGVYGINPDGLVVGEVEEVHSPMRGRNLEAFSSIRYPTSVYIPPTAQNSPEPQQALVPQFTTPTRYAIPHQDEV